MLKGKTAVVTGSTSGIGLGIAKVLAAQGCKVAINDHTDSDEARKVATDLAAETGAEVIYVAADMSKADACVHLIEEATEKLGGLDILVNNAGIQHVEKIEDFPVGKWDAIIAINLSSAFHTTRAAMAGMKQRGHGRIVNIASAHGLTASPYKSAYVAAKHGVVGLSKTVALEAAAAKVDVTCNAICPGYVWTPLVEAQLEDQMKANDMTKDEVIDKVMLTRTPTREFATVEQIGETTAFLCSDGAAQITGTTISVDGGWTAM
jgi:3-hydroxybutyrate dehydrogenase